MFLRYLGEMFQLLDRDSGGRSQYPIDISEDLKLYLSQEIFNNKNISDDLLKEIKSILTNGLVFPENLFIWATMNNADQGVMPLDTHLNVDGVSNIFYRSSS